MRLLNDQEEIVSALKNSLQVCREVQAWALGRLEQIFRSEKQKEQRKVQLRRSSWEEIHRLLTSHISQFIQPRSSSSAQRTVSNDGGVANQGDGSGDECDDEEEDDEDGHSSQHTKRFQIRSLDHFYRQNTSADGAATVGLVFQKALSCLLSFEAAASATATCKDGLPVPTMMGTGSMIHWVTDFVSNWEFFFHWISQRDEDNALRGSGTAASRRSSSEVQAFDKKVMWQLLSRIGIGCALCSVAIDHILWRKDSDRQHMHRPHGQDGDQLSVWALLEVQFSLHRLLRKLITVHGAAIDVKLSKEHLSASFCGVSSVLDARSAQTIAEINSTLAFHPDTVEDGEEEVDERDLSSGRSGGLSFDGVLFALDSCCCSSYGDEKSSSILSSASASAFKQRQQSGAEGGGLGILKSLLNLYFNVRDRVFANPNAADDHSSSRSVFTVYADSLVAKFPKPMRHLVAAPKNAKQVVLLDAKSAEDILVRVFTAIGRVVDAEVEAEGVSEVDRQLQQIMSCGSEGEQQDALHSGFLALAAMFLEDLKAFMSFDELTKLKLTSVLLVKRLCDHGAAGSPSANTNAFALEMLRLSSVSYEIMCEHVVYHLPLLRVLLSICFSVAIGKSVEAVVELNGVLEGFLLATGFELEAAAPPWTIVSNSATITKSKEPKVKVRSSSSKERSFAKKRKRLRQLSMDDSSDSIVENRDGDEHEETGSIGPQPHLASSEAQSAAIHALVTLLDVSQATLFKCASTRQSGFAELRRPAQQSILLYIPSSHQVLHALLTAKDVSWVNARVLVKLLSAIEWGLRIGKACLAVTATKTGGGRHPFAWWSRVSIELFEACVQMGLRGRTWTNSLKESIKDAATKTRVGAALDCDLWIQTVTNPTVRSCFSVAVARRFLRRY